jgi:hypothetical protein
VRWAPGASARPSLAAKEKSRGDRLAAAAQVQGGNAQEVRYGTRMPQRKNMWRALQITSGFLQALVAAR